MRPVPTVIAAAAIVGLIASLTVEAAAVFGHLLIPPRPGYVPASAISGLPVLYGHFRLRERYALGRGLGDRCAELPRAVRALLGVPWLFGALGVLWGSVDLSRSIGPAIPDASIVRAFGGGCAMFFAGTAVHALARAIAPVRRTTPANEAGGSGEPRP